MDTDQQGEKKQQSTVNDMIYSTSFHLLGAYTQGNHYFSVNVIDCGDEKIVVETTEGVNTGTDFQYQYFDTPDKADAYIDKIVKEKVRQGFKRLPSYDREAVIKKLVTCQGDSWEKDMEQVLEDPNTDEDLILLCEVLNKLRKDEQFIFALEDNEVNLLQRIRKYDRIRQLLDLREAYGKMSK